MVCIKAQKLHDLIQKKFLIGLKGLIDNGVVGVNY